MKISNVTYGKPRLRKILDNLRLLDSSVDSDVEVDQKYNWNEGSKEKAAPVYIKSDVSGINKCNVFTVEWLIQDSQIPDIVGIPPQICHLKINLFSNLNRSIDSDIHCFLRQNCLKEP